MPQFIFADNKKNDPILAIFNKYEEKEGVESITISPALIGMMKNNKANDKKTQELIAKISGLRILSIHKSNGHKNPLFDQFISELRPVLNSSYDQILKIKSEGNLVELYIRNNSKKDNEEKGTLLFITSEKDVVTVMHLSGNIDSQLIDAVMNGDIGTTR